MIQQTSPFLHLITVAYMVMGCLQRMRVNNAGNWILNWNSSLWKHSEEMPPNYNICSRKICISGWFPLLGTNHLRSLQVTFFSNLIFFSLAGDNNIQWGDPTSNNYYQNWFCSFNWKRFSSSLPAWNHCVAWMHFSSN